MIELRDGTEVEDSRLGLLSQSDSRSDAFKVDTSIESDDRVYETGDVLDQGTNGACVGYAFAHLLKAQGWTNPAIDGGWAWNVYTAAQKIDPWPGGEYPRARPQMIGTSLLAGAKVLHRAGYIPEYRWANTVHQVRAGLTKGPGVLGCMWRASMDEVNPNTHQAHVKGRKVGGHALIVSGVIGDMFIVTNSWGTEWGGQGMAFISADDMTKLLKDRVGKVVFPGRHASVAA